MRSLDDDDMRARNAAAARRATSRAKTSGFKPLTNRQKMAAARAAKGSHEGVEEEGEKRKKKLSRTERKVPGMLTQLQAQIPSVVGHHHHPRSSPPALRAKVPDTTPTTFTTTWVSARARRYREQQQQQQQQQQQHKPDPLLDLNQIFARAKAQRRAQPAHPFRLADLPQEVQIRIFRCAVVDPVFATWPTSVTGREQPDLALVSRGIRAAVLPIYYGENVYGVSVESAAWVAENGPARRVVREPMGVGLAAVRKWARMLEEGGWLGWVGSWCFEHHGPDEEASFVVFVREAAAAAARERTGLMDGRFEAGVEKEGFGEESAVVVPEIHQSAACVLLHGGRCVAGKVPRLLGDVISSWQLAQDGKAEGLVEVGRAIRDMAAVLAGRRCETVAISIE
jgi:hypothetical protein